MIGNYALLAGILGIVMLASVLLKKVTLPAALLGAFLGIGVYAGAGFTGIAMMGIFFIAATIATTYKHKWKENQHLSSKREQQRTAGQVFANGGVAGILGALALLFPQKAGLVQILIGGSLASALADTASSELGVVFGKRFYNIRTWKKEPRGLNGVVSFEGTLIGMAGSAVIAGIYAGGYGFDSSFLAILFAGAIGNAADSVLGATLERSHLLNNNTVNFLNTLTGALAAGLLFTILKP